MVVLAGRLINDDDAQYTQWTSSVLQDTIETTLELVKRKPVAELQCYVCGKKTGCNECEYLSKCEARIVSKFCICKECIKQEESFHNYQQSLLLQ